jgi:hypothetical protein
MHQSLTSATLFAAVAIMTACSQSNPASTSVMPHPSVEVPLVSARPASSPSLPAPVSLPAAAPDQRVGPAAHMPRHSLRTVPAKTPRPDNSSPLDMKVREFASSLQGMSIAEHVVWAEKELAARNIETNESPQNTITPAPAVRSVTSQTPETGSVKAPQ